MNISRDIPVVILESSSPRVLGDISIFRTFSDAERAIEPVDAKNLEYFAFTLGGCKLDVETDGRKVHLKAGEDKADYSGDVRKLLEQAVRIISENRKLQLEPDLMSMEELVGLIGYSR